MSFTSPVNRRVARHSVRLSAIFAACALALAGCQTGGSPQPVAAPAPATAPPAPASAAVAPPPAPTPAVAAPAAPPVPETVSFDQAIERAATALFSSAEKVPGVAPTPPRVVMIDPLVDGNTAQQTVSSEAMGKKIANVIGNKFPRFAVEPFRKQTLDRNPLLLVGTLTAINAANDPKARNDIYRICLALVDVKAGKIVAKGLGRATEQSVNATPLPYYSDSPTWVKDKIANGYIRTCQGTRAGDAADALYIETLPTAMLLDEAVRAYHARKFADAHRLYRTAVALPGGEQKRVVNGLYLTSWKLNRSRDAEDAFGKIVVRGLEDKNLGVKFLFRPNSSDFVANADLRRQYALWTKVIAQRATEAGTCLSLVGHTSKTGNDQANDALSLKRADAIKRALVSQSRKLSAGLTTKGSGARETIVGSGTDDLRDALDRRVDFKVTDCT